MKKCKNCKCTLSVNKSPLAKYCSVKCRASFKWKRIYQKRKLCVVCKKQIVTTKYCSSTCQKLLYRYLRRKKALQRIVKIINNKRYVTNKHHYSKSVHLDYIRFEKPITLKLSRVQCAKPKLSHEARDNQ